MGQKDIAEKILESYNDVFADIVNVLMFEGECLVAPDDLEECTARSAYKADHDYHPSGTIIKHVQATLSMLSIMTGDYRFEETMNDVPKEREQVWTMCDVLDRIENRGIEKGIERGIEKGIEKGRTDCLLESIYSLMSSLKFTPEQAMEALQLPPKEQERLLGLMR